jgi:hypothetical protein
VDLIHVPQNTDWWWALTNTGQILDSIKDKELLHQLRDYKGLSFKQLIR